MEDLRYLRFYGSYLRLYGISIYRRVIIPLKSKYERFRGIHAQDEGRSGVFILDRYIY